MKDASVKYALKQSFSAAVPTIVLLFALGIVQVKTDMDVSTTAADLPLTMFLTALICTIVQVFITKNPVKKGAAPAMTPVEKQAAYAFIPKNIPAYVILISLAATFLFACGPVGLFQIVAPEAVIGRWVYITMKSILVGVVAGYATFHANTFLCAIYQEQR